MGYSKVRKIGVLVVLLVGVSAGSRAQGVDQLIEQLVLDIQKLSQLKTILQDMKDGYLELDKGYTNIRDIVTSNYNLHKVYLDGLLRVSPTVRAYYKVPAVIDKERKIVAETQAASRRWAESGVFTASELGYMQQTYAVAAKHAGNCVDRLTMVTTADELRMTDADRLQAIDQIHADATVQLEGLRRFNDAVAVQAIQRAKEKQSVWMLKKLYDTP